MTLAGYVLFLLISYWLVLQILRLTTYHAYFFKALPLLLAYSVLVGFALYLIPAFYSFWIMQIWASALLFMLSWRKQARQGRAFFNLLAEGASEEEQAAVRLSVASTRCCYFSSAVVYLVTYAFSFLVFLNTLGGQ